MKIPSIVEKDATYYILVSWLVSSVYGETVNRAYKTLEGAKRAAGRMMATGDYKSVMIRREDVWKRDELHEYSSSTPIIEVLPNGIKTAPFNP